MDRFRMLPNYQYHDDDTGVLETNYKKELRDYQIYGNSIQDGEPSPYNPIEIQSVREKTTNLWGKETATAYEDSYGTLKYEWDDKGGVYFYNTSVVQKGCKVELNLPPGIYSVHMSIRGYVRKNGSLVKIGDFATVSSTEEFILTTEFNLNSGKTGYLQAMVVDGEYTVDTMPEFEPQGKYKIPIEVSGKNLFDMKTLGDLGFELQEDGSYFGNSYKIGTKTIWTNAEGLKGSFYLDGVMTSADGILGYSFRTFYTDGTWKWSPGVTDANKTVDYIELAYGRQKEMYLSNFIIAHTSIETPYEPYQEPQTYNIFLDEPLRKCGDYADYIDFKNGKVVRNINKRYLSDLVTTGTQYTNGLCRFQQSMPNTNYTVAPISNCMIGSNKLSAYANVLSFADEYKNLYAYFYASSVGLEPVEKTTTNAEIGAAIKRYITDKNIYFYHVFKTPTETAIELPKIQLNKGTNIIKVKTATQPSQVNWQYYK